jgi:hypothetical protein
MKNEKKSNESDKSILSELNEDQTDKGSKKSTPDESGSSVLSKINDDPKD